MSPTFELHAGALRLALRPDLGGCIAGLWHRGTPVLRSLEPAAAEPRRARRRVIPLLPYSNRLGYRRFRCKGKDYTTAPNFDDSPHSVHGVGWQRAGRSSRVRARSRDALEHHADADWPFAFEASQHVMLTPTALDVQLVLRNRAANRSRSGSAGTRISRNARAAGCTSS